MDKLLELAPKRLLALGCAALIVGTDLLSLRLGAAIWDGAAVAAILWLYRNDN